MMLTRGLWAGAALAGLAALGGCHFMTPSGGAAQRWAAIEDARAARAAPEGGAPKICKSMMATGSIMPQQVCSTQAEWDAFDAQAAESAETFNDLRRSGSPAPGQDGQQY